MRKMLKKRTIYLLGTCLIMAIVFFLYITGRRQEEKTIVTIAVMQDDNVQNFNSNYYTQWLEEKTGYDIQFEYISEGYEKEYLYAMLTADRGRIDAVFLPKREEILSMEEFTNYAKEGLICDMTDFVTNDSHFTALLEQYSSISMREKICETGSLYYMPNMDTARSSRNMQVLWINMGWLTKLGLSVPKTVDELYTVLEAFRDCDPNENGIEDELPLISCEAAYALQSYNFILNAYIYNDPLHNRTYVDENGDFASAVTTPAFMEGLLTCRQLYEKGLLSGECNEYSNRQFMELVNAPEDVVGAFTSQSIADVIYPNCPDILARFIQVPPLMSEGGEQNAVYMDCEPAIGGYIPANSSHPQEAFEIMDLMLSEEASLIASFGEENVDWKFSENGDLSTYGNRAKISTICYLRDTVQNKHFAGAGPLVLSEDYANSVTWNGDNSLVEYLDARAVKYYESSYYENRDRFYDESWFDYVSNQDKDKTDAAISAFIFGIRDITSDEAWEDLQSEVEIYE